jgi:VWFA-related protein
VSSVHLRWGLVSFALLFSTLPFQAQTVSNEGQAPTPTFKAETRAVDVDVVVLDSHGQPVKGLRKEDFVITEDGTPQAATFFEEHPSETAQSDAAANVLLIDTLNTPAADLGFVRRRVADYLKKMPAGTSLAVFSLGQTLRMVQGFTTDRALLQTAVENNKTGAYSETSSASNMPQDDADDQERAEILNSGQAPPNSVDMVNNAQAMRKSYQNDQRIAMTIGDLERLARYLAKMPGRKNLIWFSSSFPIALFPEPGKQGSLATSKQNQQIKETTDLLAVARVAIYPVNAQGVAVQTTGDASDHYGTAQNALPGSGPGTAPPSGTSAQSTGGDTYQYGAVSNGLRQEDNARAANFAAMNALASATGGEALPTSNDLSRMLARALSNGSQYYTLSYTPSNTAANAKADGSFRRIDVRLRSGNYKLAYRKGYYATETMLGPAPTATAKTATAKTATPAENPSPIPNSTPAQLHTAAPPPVTAPAPAAALPSVGASAPPHKPELVQRTPEVIKQAVKARRLIHLDVLVTDPSGHAVSGLAQPDFTVLDDNRAQPLASFHAMDGLTAEPPVEIVLVLDTMNTSFQQMAAVRQGVEKFLRQNAGHLALPVSAVFLTDTGIKANRATRDGNALAADIEKLPTPVHVINSAQGLDGLMLRFGRSVDALSQMTRYEATKPGRKLMIWVGSGWPMLSNARYHMDPKNQASFFHSIVDLSTSLREARVTLYGVFPLDLNRGSEAYAFLYQNYMKGVASAKQADAGNLSLQVLAEQSGGRALGPTGDVYGSLVRCVADANAYYELSFDSAPTSTVDVYHGLQVTLDKPGLAARTNAGYYAQP